MAYGYSRDQIVNDKYKKICEYFLKMARTKKMRKQLYSILYDGGFDNFSVNVEKMSRSNPRLEAKKRIAYANLLVTNPETFEVIKDNNITVFHGTNSSALPNIIKYGIRTVNMLNEEGIPVVSGEKWSRILGERDFISFTDDIDISSDYAAIGNKEHSSFGVVFGLSSEALKKQSKCSVHSDLPEIGIRKAIEFGDIGFIGVPKENIDFVRKIVNNENIIVAPLKMEDKFYYIDELGEIYIDDDKAKKIINDRNKSKILRTFGKKDVKEMAKGRTKHGIIDIYRKIKNRISSRAKNDKDLENEVI